MLFQCDSTHFKDIYEIINDGASAYRGIIPADRWKEPYMGREELKEQMEDGVVFWSYCENEQMLGVMGLQDKDEVMLIRHAYVRTSERNKGIGGVLLQHLSAYAKKPVLIGTWKDAGWAIGFYLKHGFQLVSEKGKISLLRKFWTIPERQVETSIVLASRDWTSIR